MAGPDFIIAQGDTASSLADVLLDADGVAVDIQGATVSFQLAPVGGGAYVVDTGASNDQNGDGTDGTLGNVSYAWAAGDTDSPGYYLGRWVVTFSDTSEQTFPNDGFFLVYISADVSVSPPSAFATSDQLAARLGLDFSAAEHVRAATLLELASAAIRSATGQEISLIVDDVISFYGDYRLRVTLPQRPVVGVASLKVNGTTLDPDGYYLDGVEIVRSGSVWPFWGVFAGTRDLIEVTYTHGFVEVPGDVVAICLDMCARAWVNPGAVVGESVGSSQVTYATAEATGLQPTDREMKQLGRAIRRTVGTVVLR